MSSIPNEDKYEKIIAIVNGGSGIVFQPMTEKYSYILTAKHTLYEDKEMKKSIKNHQLKVKGSNIEFIKKYEHDILDIAILKIKKLNIEDSPLPWIGELDKDKYSLFGHPKYNRSKDNTLDNFKVTANKTQKDESIIIFDEEDYSGQEIIEGVSGGGIFRDLDSKIYLIAIEFEMNIEKSNKRRDRRIKAVAIKAFDEIVDKHKNKLVYLDENRNKKGRENMVNNYLNFLVNRYDIRHDIEHFINSKHRKFLIKYDDDWDDPLDIILWLKEIYAKKGYNFIKFDLSENNRIDDSLEDKTSPTIERYRKENPNQFKEFDSRVIQKNKSDKNIMIGKMAKFLTERLGKSKSTLEILKDDFLKIDKIIVVLSINALVKYNSEKLYYELNEVLDLDNIKLIIITNNEYDFKEIDVFKTVFLNKIKRKTIKKYLTTTDVKQSKVDSFYREIDGDISHNDIKNEMIKYFNLTSSPIEGEKNANK
jgi:hypothetical protein